MDRFLWALGEGAVVRLGKMAEGMEGEEEMKDHGGEGAGQVEFARLGDLTGTLTIKLSKRKEKLEHTSANSLSSISG